MRKKFTIEEKNIICSMYKQGYTATQICRAVASLNDRKPQTLYPILIKAGLYIKKPADDLRKHYVDDNYFDIIDTEHKAYWLGFLIADGFIVNSGHSKNCFGITLKSDDKYILEQFKNDLKTNYTIKDYDSVCKYNGMEIPTKSSRLLICSKKIYNKLIEYGFSTNKSHDATLPLDVIPQNLLNHFIRGYFDGDGGFSKPGDKKYHTYSITFTGTYEVIFSIRAILNKTNVKMSERHPDRDNNNYYLALCGDKQVYNIGKWLYNGATIYLNRKHERFLELSKKYINK